MESIGEKLRLARERNNLTIEQVARETHVAKRFLKALEDEEFATFPGETYAMGFLRNYSEYLGLDPEELVGIYRNIKIQEQPLPMNELLESKPRMPSLRTVLFIAAAVLAVAAVGYLIYRATGRAAGPASGATGSSAPGAAELVFQDDVRTQWFSQGDVIAVPLGAKSYRIVIFSIGDTLILKVPGGTVELGLGKERYLDLDGDSTPDLRVVWNDVDRGPPVKRANLGLYRTNGPAVSSSDTTGVVPSAAGAAPAAPLENFKPIALTQAAQAGLFQLDFTFKNDCYFRYAVDAGDREDRFFQKGEQFTIDTARKQVTIWMSNAGAARMRVQGRDFELGDLGEVATRRIAWQPDASSGGFVLQVAPVY